MKDAEHRLLTADVVLLDCTAHCLWPRHGSEREGVVVGELSIIRSRRRRQLRCLAHAHPAYFASSGTIRIKLRSQSSPLCYFTLVPRSRRPKRDEAPLDWRKMADAPARKGMLSFLDVPPRESMPLASSQPPSLPKAMPSAACASETGIRHALQDLALPELQATKAEVASLRSETSDIRREMNAKFDVMNAKLDAIKTIVEVSPQMGNERFERLVVLLENASCAAGPRSDQN